MFWPHEKVQAWLEPNWDAWMDIHPLWFNARFKKLVFAVAPPASLPLTVLRSLALKHKKLRLDKDGRVMKPASMGRDELVEKEKKRRANLIFERTKQLCIWVSALFFRCVASTARSINYKHNNRLLMYVCAAHKL